MNEAQAERWITVSAVIVAGIYAYRSLTETSTPPATAKKLAGIGELAPLGSFATAWGFMFLVIAIMAQMSPGLGGSFAILIATGDFLTNSRSVLADVGKQENGASAAKTAGATLGLTGPIGTLTTLPAVSLPYVPAGDHPLTPLPPVSLTPPADVPQVPIITAGHGLVP